MPTGDQDYTKGMMETERPDICHHCGYNADNQSNCCGAVSFWLTQCEALEKALSEIAQEKFLRRMVADDLAIETLAAHRKAVEAFGKETK